MGKPVEEQKPDQGAGSIGTPGGKLFPGKLEDKTYWMIIGAILVIGAIATLFMIV